MLFSAQFPVLKGLRIFQISSDVLRADRILMVAGQDCLHLICKGAQLFLALNIQIQIPVAAEHKDRSGFLHGITGQEELLKKKKKRHTSISMSGNPYRLKVITAARKYISF